MDIIVDGDPTVVEDGVGRVAAIVLAAQRLAERQAQRASGRGSGPDPAAAERLASLHWAVRAGRVELQRLAQR